MPFGMDVPGSSGSKDKSSGEDDLDATLKMVDELSGKLEEKEKLIYGMLSKAVPKVDIPMPKLNPTMFGGSAAGGKEYEPLLRAEDSDSKAAEPPKGQKMTKAKMKAEEVRKKTLEAKKQAAEAQAQMAEEAKNAMANQMSKGKQVLAQSFAAATSVAVGVGLSFAPVSALLGQILAGVSAALLNFLGLAASWKSSTGNIFQVMSKVFDRMMKKVVNILDTVDDMIMGPLEKLENAIEDMCEEQKPNLDKMKELESTIKMVQPDFNAPDPEDLKKPLDGCGDMIDEFVDKAKKEIPDKMQEIIQSTLPGRLATDESSFNLYVVILPLSLVFLVNMGLAVGQVFLMFKPEDSESDDFGAVANSSRSLRGANVTSLGINATLPSLGSNATLPTLPKELSVDSVMPYVQPALVQILLAALQMVGAMILSSGPRICGMINGSIADFGKKINDRINNRIKSAVDKVFGSAFKEVKGKSDEFFPKFKDAIKLLKQALETAAKAGAMAGALGSAAKMF